MSKEYLSINSKISQLIGAYNSLVNKVGDLAQLNTLLDSDLVSSLNSLIGEGGLDSSEVLGILNAGDYVAISDIPNAVTGADIVTLGGEQTLTGQKTFNLETIFKAGVSVKNAFDAQLKLQSTGRRDSSEALFINHDSAGSIIFWSDSIGSTPLNLISISNKSTSSPQPGKFEFFSGNNTLIGTLDSSGAINIATSLLTKTKSDALYQPLNSILASIAGLATAANKLPYFTGAGVASQTDFTSTARQLLDDSSFGQMRTTLGLGIGTNVQAYHPLLSSVSSLAVVSGDLLFGVNATTLSRLAKSTDGKILSLASGLPAWVDAGGPWTEVSGSPFTVSGASPYSVTGLGAYRDLMVVLVDITATVAGDRLLRVGNSGGFLSTAVYESTGSGATNRLRVSNGGTNGKSATVQIMNFNTTQAIKPTMQVADCPSDDVTTYINSATAFDRVQVLNTAAATLGGALRIFGRN